MGECDARLLRIGASGCIRTPPAYRHPSRASQLAQRDNLLLTHAKEGHQWLRHSITRKISDWYQHLPFEIRSAPSQGLADAKVERRYMGQLATGRVDQSGPLAGLA